MTLAVIVLAAYLGIDVAHDSLEVVIRIERRTHHTQVPNTLAGWQALGEWVQRFHVATSRIHACLEATGSYSDGISDWLVQAGFRVSVLNPSILSDYREYQRDHGKTDLRDAALLAQYAEKEEPASYVPLPAEVLTLRRLVRFRQQLCKMVGQAQHRLHAARMTAWMRERTVSHRQDMEQWMDQVEMEIRQCLLTSTPLMQASELLQTIPGIGWWTAAIIVAEIGEIKRFAKVGSLVNLAGLSVVQHQSGTSVHKRPHISRRGREVLRSTIYLCAASCLRSDAGMQRWAQRMRDRGCAEHVIMGATMRKLVHIIYGVWSTQTPYDAHKAFAAVL